MGNFNYAKHEYISSRSADQLQFDVNKIKLGQLPGLFERIQEEGGFFKKWSDMWKNGPDKIYDDPDEGMTEEEPEAVLENSYIVGNDLSKTPVTEMFAHNHWVNPAFKDKMISNVKGGIAAKTLYGTMRSGGSDEMWLAVYYEVETGTVIAWEYDVD